MSIHTFRLYAMALLGLVGPAIALHGQTTADLTQHVGIDPYGTYSGSNVDHVDMNSGNISVQIPLFTLPQKGKLILGYQLVLNNNGWAPQRSCDNYGCLNTWMRSTIMGPAIVPIEDPWVSSYALVSAADTAPPCITDENGNTSCGSGYSSPWQAIMGYNIVEPDGARHSLLVDGSNDTTLRTYDGSEYLYTPDFLYPFDLYYNETTTTSSPASRHATYVTNPYGGGFGDMGFRAGGIVTTPAGIRYCNPDPILSGFPSYYNPHPDTNPCGTGTANQSIGPTTEVVSDTNGNRITVTPAWHTGNFYYSNGNGSIITDSTGRTFSGPPASTASTAGCPVITNPDGEPVTADSSSIWNVPGPNGSVSYLICYKNISISTNFDMWSISGTENSYTPCPDTYTPGYNGTLYCNANWQYTTGPNQQITVIQSVVLPNGTYWGFSYNPSADSNGGDSGKYGDIWQIILPSGGRIRYSYLSANPNLTDGNRYIASRTMVPSPGTGESSATWQYSWNPAQYFSDSGCNVAQDSKITGPDGTITAYTHTYNRGCWPSASTVSTTGVNSEAQSTTTNFNLVFFNNPQLATNIPLEYPLSWASGTSPWAGYFIGVQSLPSSMTTTVSSGGSSYKTTTTYTYDKNGAPATPPRCSLAGTYYASGQVSYGYALYSYQANDLCAPFETSDVTAFQKLGWSLDNNSWTGWSYNQQSAPLASSAPMGSRTGTIVTGTTGQLLSASTTSYVWQQSSSNYALNLMDRVYQQTAYTGLPDSEGSYASVPIAAQATYTYDESVYNQGGPGNLTKTVKSNVSGQPAPAIHSYYNAQGYVYQTDDANNYQTTVAGFDCSSGTSTPPVAIGVSTYLQTTTAGGLTSSAWRDCNTGAVLETKDPNNQVTVATYDKGGKPITINSPDSGSKSFDYHGYSTPLHITETVLSGTPSSPVALSTDTYADGFGRTIQTVGPSGAKVDTVYDDLGRVHSISNPYLSTASGFTTYAYDGLNRMTQLARTNVPKPQQWSYAGSTVTYTDEKLNQWQRTYDEQGRLTKVVEPGSLNTTYSYDVLGNLQCVDQWGTGTPSTSCNSSHRRSFSYDMLSRLLTTNNLETGTVGYSYDGNGNVQTKTDARGVVTHYSYDALNRLLSKYYTNAPAGAMSNCYQFDNPASGANGLGHLWFEWTQTGSCPTALSAPPALASNSQTLHVINSYDPMGRVVAEQQCAAGRCSSSSAPQAPQLHCTVLASSSGLQFCYDLAGNMLAYNAGTLSLSQTFDTSGRLSTVGSSMSDGTHPANLFAAQGYTAANALQGWRLGPNLFTVRGYDTLNRVCQQKSAVQQLPSLTNPECQ